MPAASVKLEKYSALNKRLLKLMGQEGWTPATFALVMSGVAPVPGCTGIPESAGMLEDETQPASAKELGIASRLLDHWLESELDDDLDDESKRQLALRSQRPVVEYLIWSLDYDLPLPHWRPRLMEYVHALWREPEYALQSAPADIVERAYALEHHAAIEAERRAPAQAENSRVDSERSVIRGSSADRLPFGGNAKGKQPAIAPEIREAQDALDDVEEKLDVKYVWAVLRKLALSGQHTRLKGVSGESIIYVAARGECEYSYDLLQKYLESCRKRVSKKGQG